MFRRSLFVTAIIGSATAAHGQQIPVGQTFDTTVISGLVEPICTVETLNPTAIVALGTQAAQDVTKVTYTCNDTGGFTRTVSSANGGSLRRGAQAIPYLISQQGNETLSFAPLSLSAPHVNSVSTFPQLVSGVSVPLEVTVPSVPSGLLAGEYSDTVTIEITPN